MMTSLCTTMKCGSWRARSLLVSLVSFWLQLIQATPSLEESSPANFAVTLVDCDDPFSLAAQKSTGVVMEKLSNNAWVHCGAGKYILDMLGKLCPEILS